MSADIAGMILRTLQLTPLMTALESASSSVGLGISQLLTRIHAWASPTTSMKNPLLMIFLAIWGLTLDSSVVVRQARKASRWARCGGHA